MSTNVWRNGSRAFALADTRDAPTSSDVIARKKARAIYKNMVEQTRGRSGAPSWVKGRPVQEVGAPSWKSRDYVVRCNRLAGARSYAALLAASKGQLLSSPAWAAQEGSEFGDQQLARASLFWGQNMPTEDIAATGIIPQGVPSSNGNPLVTSPAPDAVVFSNGTDPPTIYPDLKDRSGCADPDTAPNAFWQARVSSLRDRLLRGSGHGGVESEISPEGMGRLAVAVMKGVNSQPYQGFAYPRPLRIDDPCPECSPRDLTALCSTDDGGAVYEYGVDLEDGERIFTNLLRATWARGGDTIK